MQRMSDTRQRTGIDKRTLIEAIAARLEEDLDSATRSQEATQAGATHAEARPEHAKDTRALESTYLARGLAERVVEIERDLAAIRALDTRPLGPMAAVGTGALVSLEDEEGEASDRHFFITPSAGGLSFEVGGITVRTLTPAAPIAQALLGLDRGDTVELRSPGGSRRWVISRIA